MKNVKIVIGANFGDEGKGLMTDYFTSGSNDIVVLSNGGHKEDILLRRLTAFGTFFTILDQALLMERLHISQENLF